jgi:hypothetical protein
MACRPIERLNKVAMGLSAERLDIRKRSDLLYFVACAGCQGPVRPVIHRSFQE